MADDLADIRRRLAQARRALEDAAAQSFAAWHDEVGISVARQFLAPLREAVMQFEKALRALEGGNEGDPY
ncbi:MAG: hypothetical protein NTV97_26305 [Alphaproteobacteria bacterium]|nr:hypothetical protein [Alphaproteobacteria bacterium]